MDILINVKNAGVPLAAHANARDQLAKRALIDVIRRFWMAEILRNGQQNGLVKGIKLYILRRLVGIGNAASILQKGIGGHESWNLPKVPNIDTAVGCGDDRRTAAHVVDSN